MRDGGGILRFRRSDIFLAEAGAHQRQRLLGGGQARLIGLELRFGEIVLRLADRAGLEELRAALEILAGLHQRSASFGDARFSLGDVLRPIAGAALVAFGTGDIDLRLRGIQRIGQRLGIELRQNGSRFHMRAFLHRHGGNAAGHAEAEIDGTDIDIAVEGEGPSNLGRQEAEAMGDVSGDGQRREQHEDDEPCSHGKVLMAGLRCCWRGLPGSGHEPRGGFLRRERDQCRPIP